MPPSLKGKILVLDTHAFIWFLADDPKLSDTAKAAIQEGLEQKALLVLPSIVLAEAIDIVQKKRTHLKLDAIWRAIEQRSLHLWPLDEAVLREMAELDPSVEIHDRIIAAVALLLGGAVITKDQQIAKLAPVVW